MGKVIKGNFKSKNDRDKDWDKVINDLESEWNRAVNIAVGGVCLVILMLAGLPFFVEYVVEVLL